MDRGWLLVGLGSIIGFLPVLTLRSRVARVVCGLFAAMFAAAAAFLYSAASAPGVGLAAFIVAIPMLAALAVLCVLFSIGLAGAVTRVIDRGRPARVSWGLTAGLSVLFAVVLFGVPYAMSRLQASSFYAGNDAIVAAGRDSAGPQSQWQLTQRVVGVLTSAADGRPEPADFAGDGVLQLWHPGARENGRHFLADPRFTDPNPEDGTALYVRQELMDQFRPSTFNGTWEVAKPGDEFVTAWHEVPLSAIDEMSRWMLSFYDDTRWNGNGFSDGKPLFPAGHFYAMDVSLVRGELKAPFLVLFAVDDGGKWWLVGIKNPNIPGPSTQS